jgi:hypothetical protein
MSTVHEHMLSHFNLLFWDTNSKQYADVYWTKDDKKHFVQHKGYVALFPLLLRVIDTSDDGTRFLLFSLFPSFSLATLDS